MKTHKSVGRQARDDGARDEPIGLATTNMKKVILYCIKEVVQTFDTAYMASMPIITATDILTCLPKCGSA